ncbi:MAG TPA: phytanoyl-CoA dioxygenase family protein, partial [Thermoanaerobaculia bacterium]|nr:phytanoyl-CoA dioxygenase family protein [Thermoanaerobaculia bacterium]
MTTIAFPPLDSEYAIQKATLNAFARDGHACLTHLVSDEELAGFRPSISAVVNAVDPAADRQGRIDDYSKLFIQVTNIWRLDPLARRVVFARRFARAAARLLGVPSVRLYHDQALFKPPGGARTPWHQDRWYWPLATDRTVTMWLALVDIPPEAGPMRFAAGSHRATSLGNAGISEGNDRRLAQLIEERGWPEVSAPLAAGDATFHIGGLLHSAGANTSVRVREALTVIFFADGSRIAEPANANQRVDLEVFFPGLKPGDLAATE